MARNTGQAVQDYMSLREVLASGHSVGTEPAGVGANPSAQTPFSQSVAAPDFKLLPLVPRGHDSIESCCLG